MSPSVACANCSASIMPGARFCSRCGHDVSGPQGQLTTTGIPSEESGPDPGLRILEDLRRVTLGEYDVVGELGRGGMAIVYLAHDIALDRKVAIKVMHPALLIGAGMSERFKREARTSAALTHPNIIPIHLVRETEGLLYFVMKYVEGRAVDSIIAETGPLPIGMVLMILNQVGPALGYAHRRGVVHRDIKPANILIDTDGWAVVTDFGIAKVAEAGTLTVSGMTVGTPNYMSPEQCSGKPVSGASDQYSLGVVAYEMIAGRPPFVADSLVGIIGMHLFESPEPLLSLRPDCPPGLAHTIEKMLAKDPDSRWPSVEDAVTAAAQGAPDRDDPVRNRMIDLARTGVKPIARISNPVSPTPIGKRPRSGPPVADASPPAAPRPSSSPPMTARPRSEAPPAPAEPRLPKTMPRLGNSRRLGLWAGLGLLGVLAVAGAFLLLRPQRVDRPQPEASALPALAIKPDSVTLEVGDTATLVLAAAASGREIAGQDSVTWTSSAPAIASVSAGGSVVGLLPGTAEMQATIGGRSATRRVTVRAVPIRAILISPASGSVPVGGTINLSATIQDARGRSFTTRSVIWSSGNVAIASINQDGMVTGVAPGEVTLEADAEGVRGRAAISVTNLVTATLAVVPSASTLTVGDSVQLAARATNGATPSRLTWESTNPAIGRVSSRGMVVALAPGSVRIRVSGAGILGGSAVVRITGVSHRPIPPAPVGQTPAYLRIQIRPSWAAVSIDGKKVGEKRDWGDGVTPGSHRLRFEREGYVTIDTTVTLQPAETLPLRIDMKRGSP